MIIDCDLLPVGQCSAPWLYSLRNHDLSNISKSNYCVCL